MSNLFEILEKNKVALPDDAREILSGCKSFTVFDTVNQLAVAAVNGENNNQYEVKYTLSDGTEVIEAIIHKVTNGISANYTEAYMRRRDPDTMLIGDDLPTDKLRFFDLMVYDFNNLRKVTIAWLQSQDLAVFFFFAGRDHIGTGGIAIAPANAGFLPWVLPCFSKLVRMMHCPMILKLNRLFMWRPLSGIRILRENKLWCISAQINYMRYIPIICIPAQVLRKACMERY